MFIVECQKAVKTTKMTETQLTDKVKPLYDWLEKLDKLLDEVPPIEQPMRFGNKAFKTWVDRFASTLDEDLTNIINGANSSFT